MSLPSKVIGILVLSVCTGTAAYAGQWHPNAHSSGAWQHEHGFAADPAPITTVAAPEIDPAGALSGLTLLLGGLAVVRGRRFRK